MNLKTETLEALARMSDGGEDAARKIVKHYLGFEFGIEYLPLPGDAEATYVNTGDTYKATLLREPSGEWIVSSYGDYLEEVEATHAEETGEVRCQFCNEWVDPEDPCHPDYS